MTKQRWMSFLIIIGFVMFSAVSCSSGGDTDVTPVHRLMFGSSPTATAAPTHLSPTRVLATATVVASPSTPTATVPVSGPAITNVRFALDVDEVGGLIFPAIEFVYGVTRVYVRFSYQELGNVAEIQTAWYLNENPISASKMAWDGDEDGDYVIWIEDPTGLGRGQWRLELLGDGDVLGGGAFIIGGEPGYVNEEWGVAFDPPPTWEMTSDQERFVTFSGADPRQALALRIGQSADGLPEIAEADVAVFRQDHPEAEVVATEETTMNGEVALLTEVRYVQSGSAESGSVGQDSTEQFLFIVSTLHGDSTYSLWVLGPADGAAELKKLLVSSLLSVRFMAGEDE